MFTVLLSLYYKEAPQYLRQSLDSIFTQKLLADEVVFKGGETMRVKVRSV